jgi:hypothetical protein
LPDFIISIVKSCHMIISTSQHEIQTFRSIFKKFRYPYCLNSFVLFYFLSVLLVIPSLFASDSFLATSGGTPSPSCTAVFLAPAAHDSIPTSINPYDQHQFDLRVQRILDRMEGARTAEQVEALLSAVVPPPNLPSRTMTPAEALEAAEALAVSHAARVEPKGLMGNWVHRQVTLGVKATVDHINKLSATLSRIHRLQAEKFLAPIARNPEYHYFVEARISAGEDGHPVLTQTNKLVGASEIEPGAVQLIRLRPEAFTQGPLQGVWRTYLARSNGSEEQALAEAMRSYDYFSRPEFVALVPQVLAEFNAKVRTGKKVNEHSNPYTSPSQLYFLVLKARADQLAAKWISEANDNRDPWAERANNSRSYSEPHRFKAECIAGLCQTLYQSFHAKMTKDLPIDYILGLLAVENEMQLPPNKRTIANVFKGLEAARPALEAELPPPGAFPHLEAKDSPFQLPDQKAEVAFDSELGTSIVYSREGRIPDPQRELTDLAHGTGSNNSHAFSWLNLLQPLIKAFRSNFIAPDAANAGNAATLHSGDSVFLAATYVRRGRKLQKWQRQAAGVSEEERVPLILKGRSAGAAVATLLLNLFFPAQNPYDITVGISTSNPKTIGQQTANLFLELVQGLVQVIDPGALFPFRDQMLHFLVQVRLASEVDMAAFRVASMRSVDFVGEADEDAGKTAHQDHRSLIDEMGLRSHFYRFMDPMKGTVYSEAERPGYTEYFSLLEAKHFLVSGQKNVTNNQAEVFFPGLPMELWPRIGNQVHEANIVEMALKDYMVDMESNFARALESQQLPEKVRSTLTSLLESSRRIKRYRDRLLAESSGAKSFFELYIIDNKLEGPLSEKESEVHFREKEDIRLDYLSKANEDGRVDEGVRVLSSGIESSQEYSNRDMRARLSKVLAFFKNELASDAAYLMNIDNLAPRTDVGR